MGRRTICWLYWVSPQDATILEGFRSRALAKPDQEKLNEWYATSPTDKQRFGGSPGTYGVTFAKYLERVVSPRGTGKVGYVDRGWLDSAIRYAEKSRWGGWNNYLELGRITYERELVVKIYKTSRIPKEVPRIRTDMGLYVLKELCGRYDKTEPRRLFH